jgi:glycine/D-amino acid oxidase-like deaminating enzyme
MSASLFTEDLKLTPYWWDHVPRPALLARTPPARADVVVIGSGYTGLCAALQTARGGRATVVLDAQDAGWGCSTRNGGQVSTSVKPGYDALARRFGADRAFRIIKEGQNSLAWVASFVAEEAIDCDFRIAGRFHAAHNPAAYEALAQRLATQPTGLEVEAHMVPRAEQHSELGTDAYYGGVLFARHASIDPGRFHQGMLDRVLAAGATVIPHCAATEIQREPGGFLVRHAGGRIVSDTRKVVYYYRASPDFTRILFGGRVSHDETNPKISGPRLHADMVKIFPELARTRISHSWAGFVAYTFDEMMHLGERDGLYYATGYCGSGAGMAGYLGTRIGQQVLGHKDGATAFDGLPFATRPYYWGNPWFLALAVAYYRWCDQRGR